MIPFDHYLRLSAASKMRAGPLPVKDRAQAQRFEVDEDERRRPLHRYVGRMREGRLQVATEPWHWAEEWGW
jgi:hypothetical protein